jgi:hypothetical protein
MVGLRGRVQVSLAVPLSRVTCRTPLLLLPIAAACFASLAAVPTVSLTATKGPEPTANTYYVGDTFNLTVTGTPGSTVTMAGWTAGTIPSSGSLVLSGTWTSSNIGSYNQVWEVNGVPATPNPLSFQSWRFRSRR